MNQRDYRSLFKSIRQTLPVVNESDIPLSLATSATATASQSRPMQKDYSPLANDVRLLGALLGRVLYEQKGEEFFRFIEKLRLTAKRAREHAGCVNQQAFETILSDTICHLDETQRIQWLQDAAVSFQLFLTLTGIAEGYHQSVQFIQDAKGVYTLIHHLKAQGVTADAVSERMEGLQLRLVATAHPTKILRHIVLRHHRDIFELLKSLHQTDLTPVQERELVEELAEKIEVLWATQYSRWRKPTVIDEARHVLSYFRHTLYKRVSRFDDRIQMALEHAFEGQVTVPNHPLVTFGSWVGGDMDGNPFVNPGVFGEIMTLQYRTILTLYADELDELAPRMSYSRLRLGPTPALDDSIADDLEQMQAAGVMRQDLLFGQDLEPIRVKLNLMALRCRHTIEMPLYGKVWTGNEFIYGSADKLVADLCLLQDALTQSSFKASGAGALRTLIAKVKRFGFHLASIDLREDSINIRDAARAIVQAAQFDLPKEPDGEHLAARDEVAHRFHEKESTLFTSLLQSPWVVHSNTLGLDSEEAESRYGSDKLTNIRRILEMLHMVRKSHQELGEASCQNLIISMTNSPADVLAALLLCKQEGLFYAGTDGEHTSHIDIVPLFETIEDLDQSARIMEALYEHPVYQTQLRCRKNRQLILLGYSDSNKDGGYLPSNWLLYQAQQRLLEVGKKYGVDIRFFHGRGGNIGRGGAPTHRAVQALPPKSARLGQDLTEQGEVLSRQYNVGDIAQAHLENIYGALLTKNLMPAPSVKPAWLEAVETMSNVAFETYRQLVGHPNFIDYFESVTPREVELVKIGSRPAKRRSAASIQDLRAIPWVFRWFQSRQIIPGWYGLGSAIDSFMNDQGEGGLAMAQGMMAHWPFFGSLISNAEISLSQTDLSIARQYLALSPNPESHEELLGVIQAEYDLTLRWITKLTGQPLLNRPEDAALAQSIDVKSPYLDPLNFIQLYLLEDYRKIAGDAVDSELMESYERAIVSSIEGIAIGVGTTG